MTTAPEHIALTVAVIQERQQAIIADIAEIKTNVKDTNALLREQIALGARLDERTKDARSEGAKWGATAGGAIGTLFALISAVYAAFKG